VLFDYRSGERRADREGGSCFAVARRRGVHTQHAQPVPGRCESGLGLLVLGMGAQMVFLGNDLIAVQLLGALEVGLG